MGQACLGFLLAVAATLSAIPAQAQVDLQYVQHSAWVVRTSSHILVFDYVEGLPGHTLPDGLKIGPSSFDQRRVVVFVSHSHSDHYSPVIQEWSKDRSDIQYVVGSDRIPIPGAKRMQPRETWTSGNLAVRTTGSTDEGVGFLVTVDGVTIFHAGDHARWVDDVHAPFLSEIDWLKATAPRIDVALFPIATGTACDPRPAIRTGVVAAARMLAPRVLIPMHVGCADRLDLYERFRSEVSSQLPDVRVVAPSRLGQRIPVAGSR